MNEEGSSFADFTSTSYSSETVADDGTLAISLLDGEVDTQTLDQFRNRLFSTVRELEKVRDWLTSPMASGLKRGLAQWALGNHTEALPTLEEHRANPTIANCLARSLLQMGRIDEAEAALTELDTCPSQAATFMACKARRGNAENLQNSLEEMRGKLSPVDVKFYEGRVHELGFESEAAIACYDEALAIDDHHGEALFRLAVNVDLRGEDEEARELYERALMIPPVNEACVINLGILYEDMGKYLRAMQCFDLALQANPENRRARMYRRDAAAALNMYYDEEQERREDKRNKILRTPINDFELSVRSRNCLSNMGIRSLGDLVNKSEAELLSFKNFGETSLMEIKEILRNKGLRLGMNQDEIMSKELGQTTDAPASSEDQPEPNSPDPLRRPITELDLSVRCRRIVDLLKIKMIGDLSGRTEAELLSCPNFGQTSLNEIRTKLDELGLALRT
jgi:DNA-directed RNA polymerase subunit alpha